MSRRLLVTLLGTCALALSGCESPVTPARTAGTYVLTPTPPASLPLTVQENYGMTVSVLADTIHLHRNGNGEHVRVQRVEPGKPGEAASTVVLRSTLGYRIRGERLEISYPCPPTANCVAPPHEIGRLEAGAFVLQSMPKEFVFRRVGS